jgi:hypothetical protein
MPACKREYGNRYLPSARERIRELMNKFEYDFILVKAA